MTSFGFGLGVFIALAGITAHMTVSTLREPGARGDLEVRAVMFALSLVALVGYAAFDPSIAVRPWNRSMERRAIEQLQDELDRCALNVNECVHATNWAIDYQHHPGTS